MHVSVVCRPNITRIDRFTTDLLTRGGPVNLDIENMGWGRFISSASIEMTYANLNNSYAAYGCYIHWNGSRISCMAPAGVGRGHRWTPRFNGFLGTQSPPSAITNYKRPVLYEIFSEFNKTKTSSSAGGEVFNVFGNNFGPISERPSSLLLRTHG
jgi:hypothetical protein